WMIGLLAVGASIAPWIAHGWLCFGLIFTTVVLLVSYDGLTLWFVRREYAPVLLLPEKGLRGGEGQIIQIPLALTSSGRRPLRSEVRVAIMPATAESETAIQIKGDPQWLKLMQSEPVNAGSVSRSGAGINQWPWTPQIALLRRGLWPVPRLGVEQRS